MIFEKNLFLIDQEIIAMALRVCTSHSNLEAIQYRTNNISNFLVRFGLTHLRRCHEPGSRLEQTATKSRGLRPARLIEAPFS